MGFAFHQWKEALRNLKAVENLGNVFNSKLLNAYFKIGLLSGLTLKYDAKWPSRYFKFTLILRFLLSRTQAI